MIEADRETISGFMSVVAQRHSAPIPATITELLSLSSCSIECIVMMIVVALHVRNSRTACSSGRRLLLYMAMTSKNCIGAPGVDRGT